MTELNPVIAAIIAAVTALLIAAMGIIASVHYRLGRLEQGQESLQKSDQETRDVLRQENQETRVMLQEMGETLRQENRETREMLKETAEALRQENRETREMLKETAEALRQENRETREIMFRMNQETREMLSMEIRHTRELMAQMEERNDAQHEATRAEIRRLYDAFISHAHDDDGSVIFRIPPQAS